MLEFKSNYIFLLTKKERYDIMIDDYQSISGYQQISRQNIRLSGGRSPAFGGAKRKEGRAYSVRGLRSTRVYQDISKSVGRISDYQSIRR
ncbi:hypothetical protein KAX02_01080 [candidate division WOR-3 bacterium]|nr:hypothetical protein [candidate division WOR-3 bacterium]